MRGRSRLVPGSTRLLAVLALALAGTLALSLRADAVQGHPRVVLVSENCSQANFICQPFLEAIRRTGVSGKIVSPDVREDDVASLSLLARQGYDLIVVDPFWEAALAVVAPRFPKERFAILDLPLTEVRGRPKNVQASVFRTNEAAYLAGWLAARMEQRRPGRDVLGVVGGDRVPPVEDYIVGFRAGARHAAPHVRVLVQYSGDFTDPSKCEAIARSQIARGAGAIFNVAGACGLGTLRAAQQAGVWGIGVDTDQSGLGPHILTSVVKRFDVVMLRLLQQVRDGRIRAGVTTAYTLRNRGATLGRISPRVPASLRTQLKRIDARIVAGELRVPGVAPA
jgi:basic membrane protein A and related proteins